MGGIRLAPRNSHVPRGFRLKVPPPTQFPPARIAITDCGLRIPPPAPKSTEDVTAVRIKRALRYGAMSGRAVSDNVAPRLLPVIDHHVAQPLSEGATRRRQRNVAVAEGVAAREGGRPYGHPLMVTSHRARRARVTSGTTLGEGRKPISSRDSTARTCGPLCGRATGDRFGVASRRPSRIALGLQNCQRWQHTDGSGWPYGRPSSFVASLLRTPFASRRFHRLGSRRLAATPSATATFRCRRRVAPSNNDCDPTAIVHGPCRDATLLETARPRKAPHRDPIRRWAGGRGLCLDCRGSGPSSNRRQRVPRACHF